MVTVRGGRLEERSGVSDSDESHEDFPNIGEKGKLLIGNLWLVCGIAQNYGHGHNETCSSV